MYTVKFYKGNYGERQRAATRDGCVAFVEQHFNSSSDPNAGHAVAGVRRNASKTSLSWGRWYAHAVAKEFGIGVAGRDGILVGGHEGRGGTKLGLTTMPALLLEPLFASNPQHAAWIRSGSGQERLATILADSIQRFFPDGGKIGFSVGHKYKRNDRKDRGAAVVGGGFEADFAEKILVRAAKLLRTASAATRVRLVHVELNGEVVSSIEVADGARIRWDAARMRLLLNDLHGVVPTATSLRGRPTMFQERIYTGLPNGARVLVSADDSAEVHVTASLIDAFNAEQAFGHKQVVAGLDEPLDSARFIYTLRLTVVFRKDGTTKASIKLVDKNGNAVKQPWEFTVTGKAEDVFRAKAEIHMQTEGA